MIVIEASFFLPEYLAGAVVEAVRWKAPML